MERNRSHSFCIAFLTASVLSISALPTGRATQRLRGKTEIQIFSRWTMGSADESRGICRMGAVSGEHDLSWTSPDLSSCSTNDSDWPLSNNHYSSRSGTESVSEPLSLEQPDSVAYSDDCKNLSRTCGNGFRNYCHHRRNSQRATDDVLLDEDGRRTVNMSLSTTAECGSAPNAGPIEPMCLPLVPLELSYYQPRQLKELQELTAEYSATCLRFA